MTRAPGSINCLSPGRRAATYDYDAAMTEEHARDWLQRAEGFVAAIEEYLKREPQ